MGPRRFLYLLTLTVCLLCPAFAGLFVYIIHDLQGISYKAKKAGWFSLSESHPAPACNNTQDSHMGTRPYILCATAFIPLKNKYRFRFLLLDTCFLFFCSLYSVLLDFLYLYGLFIFTFHYQVHFNDTFSSYHYKCSRSLIIYSVFENITGLVLYQFPFEHFIRQIPYSLFSIIII